MKPLKLVAIISGQLASSSGRLCISLASLSASVSVNANLNFLLIFWPICFNFMNFLLSGLQLLVFQHVGSLVTKCKIWTCFEHKSVTNGLESRASFAFSEYSRNSGPNSYWIPCCLERETHTQTHRERKGRGGERKESEREAERQIDRQTKKVRMEKLDFLTINVV